MFLFSHTPGTSKTSSSSSSTVVTVLFPVLFPVLSVEGDSVVELPVSVPEFDVVGVELELVEFVVEAELSVVPLVVLFVEPDSVIVLPALEFPVLLLPALSVLLLPVLELSVPFPASCLSVTASLSVVL